MIYDDYLICANRHAVSCASLFELYKKNSSSMTQIHVFLDIFYLLGYVVEGVTVYSAYKINNWPSNQDIQSCDKSFTLQTNLDFYHNRMSNNHPVFAPGDVKYSVQGHCFQQIIKGLLQKEPIFNDFPYFGAGTLDPNVKNLIDKWKPEVRYYHSNQQYYQAKLANLLTENNISNLVKTCIDIIQKAHKI